VTHHFCYYFGFAVFTFRWKYAIHLTLFFSVNDSQEFSLIHSVQTGSEVRPASCPMGTGSFIPGAKAAGA
jgi:hypothetical protein